jgi:hypothetical protein
LNIVDGSGDIPVPAGVVMEMKTEPSACGGVMIVSWVSLNMLRPVPDISPNRTSVVPVKPDPVMITGVPPARGPPEGEILYITGTETADTSPTNAERMMMIRIQDTLQDGTGRFPGPLVPSLTSAAGNEQLSLNAEFIVIFT